MAVTPNSIVTPQTPMANVVTTATANTTYTDSPSNTATLATIGANGGRVTRLRSVPRAAVATAIACHLYLSLDGGTTKKLIQSRLIPVDTVSASDAMDTADWGYSDDSPMILPASAILYVSQAANLADGIDHLIEWADY